MTIDIMHFWDPNNNISKCIASSLYVSEETSDLMYDHREVQKEYESKHQAQDSSPQVSSNAGWRAFVGSAYLLVDERRQVLGFHI